MDGWRWEEEPLPVKGVDWPSIRLGSNVQVAIGPGQQLLHYGLLEKIGEGGMGDEVWKATDRRLDRTVAIKFLRHQLSDGCAVPSDH